MSGRLIGGEIRLIVAVMEVIPFFMVLQHMQKNRHTFVSVLFRAA